MLLPVTCSCLTMTWAMAVTCSTPAKPGSLLKKKGAPGFISCKRSSGQLLLTR